MEAMRKLARPTDDVGLLFTRCVANFEDSALVQRLNAKKSYVEDASSKYCEAAKVATLHEIKEESDDAFMNDMVKLYTQKFARKKSPGRSTYDKLLTATERCPLCGQRSVAVLDHHMAKAKFSALAVTPTNLVPSCRDCNTVKLALCPTQSTEQTFHPYFDDFGTERWLYAEVLRGTPPILKFSVTPPFSWSQLQADRAQYHFTIFGLRQLYATHSAAELSNMRARLVRLFKKGGPSQVRNHLAEEADSREQACCNSWQTATYHALAENEWFCDEGFERIQT